MAAQGEVSPVPVIYVAQPVASGFTDVTRALVETLTMIRESLEGGDLNVVARQSRTRFAFWRFGASCSRTA